MAGRRWYVPEKKKNHRQEGLAALEEIAMAFSWGNNTDDLSTSLEWEFAGGIATFGPGASVENFYLKSDVIPFNIDGGMELLINRELLVKAYCDTPNHRHFLHELYAHLENLWCADQVELWSQLSIHDGQRLLTIGIHCIDRDVSTHTYRALQAIGEAKILIKGNKPIWHESFGTNEGFMKLVSIVDECRCVIRRDVDMKILRLYGSPKMRSICRYNLDLMMEKQKIGMDPILETQDLRGYEGDNEDNPTGPKCPICWMEVSRGIQTDCGHDCCLDCLIDQGAAGLSPLRCFGLD
ncbi:hypothetical protein MMC14_008506, partial [Varicellaria rhodocarpa]|nr:hypothetical protein [Varicellaria rhodocarpa]